MNYETVYSPVDLVVSTFMQAMADGTSDTLFSLVSDAGIVGGVPVSDFRAVFSSEDYSSRSLLTGSDPLSYDYKNMALSSLTQCIEHMQTSPSFAKADFAGVEVLLAARDDEDALLENTQTGLRYAFLFSFSHALLVFQVDGGFGVFRVNFANEITAEESPAFSLLSRIRETLSQGF